MTISLGLQWALAHRLEKSTGRSGGEVPINPGPADP